VAILKAAVFAALAFFMVELEGIEGTSSLGLFLILGAGAFGLVHHWIRHAATSAGTSEETPDRPHRRNGEGEA
jgi:hypothetical protein